MGVVLERNERRISGERGSDWESDQTMLMLNVIYMDGCTPKASLKILQQSVCERSGIEGYARNVSAKDAILIRPISDSMIK